MKKRDFIIKVIAEEEDKFNKTIDQGLSILADMEQELEKSGKRYLAAQMHLSCMTHTVSQWI